MIEIAVCDDNRRDLSLICSILDDYQKRNPELQLQYSAFDSSLELLQTIEEHGDYDIYFIDIVMPGLTGMELISNIRSRDADVPVVILTNSRDYAVEAYSLDVSQYLLKPINTETFTAKLNKLLRDMRDKEEEYVVFHLSAGVSRIQLGSIVCVELSDHVMSFYMADGRVLESKYLRKPFAEAAAPVLADSRFLRPHHSFIINMNYVDKMTKQFFFMNNGRVVKIAKQKSKEASHCYLSYISDKWKKS